MKIVATADTHFPFTEDQEYGGQLLLPDGDVLVIAGDFLYAGTEREWYPRLEALAGIKKYKHKLFVPGNHDLFFQHYAGPCIQEMKAAGVEPITPTKPRLDIDGVRFGGCPYVTNLQNWAYNASEEYIWEYLDSIGRVDVMISHAPPRGCLDGVDRAHYGIAALRKYIAHYEPDIVICGHVHESYGTANIGRTVVYNSAMCNLAYKQTNPAWVIEYE